MCVSMVGGGELCVCVGSLLRTRGGDNISMKIWGTPFQFAIMSPIELEYRFSSTAMGLMADASTRFDCVDAIPC